MLRFSIGESHNKMLSSTCSQIAKWVFVENARRGTPTNVPGPAQPVKERGRNLWFNQTLLICNQFHKHFTIVTYGPCKKSCTVHCNQGPMQYFLNALTYFAMALCYTCNFFNEIDISDLSFNHITTVNDDSSVVNMWRISLIDNTRGVIYDRNMFIIQA